MTPVCYRVRPANGAMAETEPAVTQILKVTTGAAADVIGRVARPVSPFCWRSGLPSRSALNVPRKL
jgi:hypothetical protein